MLDDGDKDSLIRGLDKLWQRRIIREQGGETYDFTHDKLRAVAYATLSPARRRLLHRRTAQTLEAIVGGAPGIVSGHIALHYERAGSVAHAISFYQQAAAAARTIYAQQEAIDYLRRALTLAEEASPWQHELASPVSGTATWRRRSITSQCQGRITFGSWPGL